MIVCERCWQSNKLHNTDIPEYYCTIYGFCLRKKCPYKLERIINKECTDRFYLGQLVGVSKSWKNGLADKCSVDMMFNAYITASELDCPLVSILDCFSTVKSRITENALCYIEISIDSADLCKYGGLF